jgi:hypothetical protein
MLCTTCCNIVLRVCDVLSDNLWANSTFRRNVLPPSASSESKPNKKYWLPADYTALCPLTRHSSQPPLTRVEATKREPSARGYNWATLFLGDINTGTWPSRLGSLRWDSKILPWVLRDFDPRVTALARPRSNCAVNYRHVLSSERALQNNKPATVWRKFRGERKIGHGSQMGAWHQDRLADWLSVVNWLQLQLQQPPPWELNIVHNYWAVSLGNTVS